MAETTIETAVQALIDYAVAKSLITEDDEICVRNYLMDMLKLEKWEKPSVKEYGSVDEILDEIVDFAVEKEIIPQSNAWRDLFDTRIMGVFTGMPHEVNAKFKEKYAKSPKAATDWYYAYSEDTNYVRKGRIAKDIRWKYDSEYGQLDITINRSKPEKRSERYCGGKKCCEGFLSGLYALYGKYGICRYAYTSRKTESATDTYDDTRR